MESKCLICDEVFAEKGSPAQNLSKFKKPRGDTSGVQFNSEPKTKFALTSSQYTVLQKVLSLPVGVCKMEIMSGPYCKECFTNINNVCHCMSALENLQQSVQEFRKDFGNKMKASFDVGKKSEVLSGSRKRKSQGTADISGFGGVRQQILDYLKNGTFSLASTTNSSIKPQNVHDVISKIDPDGAPDTKVDAELIVCTTNGNLPLSSIKKKSKSKSKYKKSGQKNGKSKYNNTNRVSKAVSVAKSVESKAGQTQPQAVPKSSSGVPTGKKKPCSYSGCGISFYKESSLIEHLKLHRKGTVKPSEVKEKKNVVVVVKDKANYICWYCKKGFPSDDALKEHELTHQGVKECSVCQQKFTRINSLNRHMLTHENDTAKKVILLECDICRKGFTYKKSLNSHYLRFHKIPIVKVKPKSSSTAVAAHNSSKQVNNNNNKPVPRPGRCKICTRIVMDVQSHMKTSHPGESSSSSNSSIKENGKDSNKSNTTKEVIQKTTTKPGPASSKRKTTEDLTTKTKDLDKVDDDSTNKTLATTKAEVIPSEKSELKNKTDQGTVAINKPEIKTPEKDDPLPPKLEMIKPLSFFKVAAFSPPASSQAPAKKYEFKNLLKIGDKN